MKVKMTGSKRSTLCYFDLLRNDLYHNEKVAYSSIIREVQIKTMDLILYIRFQKFKSWVIWACWAGEE